MYYKRQGLPEENEIVLCKVTKIFPNSVFADLVEYNDSGMIHISEISPGRIRNIRNYVSVGRQIVCKVLRINREKGHIDLSLRRVNSTTRREKLDQIKQEIKAEQVIKNLAKKLNKKPEALYKIVTKSVFKEYSHLHLAFRDLAKGEVDFVKLGLDKSLAEELATAAKEKFKEPKILFQGEISLRTYATEGLEKVKSTLKEVEAISEKLKVVYLGAGRYKFTLEERDYKKAEDQLKEIQSVLEKFNDGLSSSSFSRRKAEVAD